MSASPRTRALTVMAPLAPWRLQWSRVVLSTLRIVAPASALAKLRFIHCAEWIVFRDLPGGGPGRRPVPGMLFIADHDGDLPEYLAAFGLVLDGGMKRSFGHTVDFPGPRPTRELIDYVERRRVPERLRWVALPQTTVREADQALAVAEALRALRRAHGPEAFQRHHGDLLLALEKAPDQVAPSVWRAALQALFTRSKVNGVSVAVPIRRGEVPRLAADLAALEAADPELLAVPGSHLARLAIIGGNTAAGASAWWPHLLLSGRFDGDRHDYLPKLAKALGPRAGDVWGRTVGFPTGGPAELAAWLERHRLPSRIFFTARQEPVDAVHQAVLDHEEALAAVAATQGGSWAERRAALSPLLLRSDARRRQPRPSTVPLPRRTRPAAATPEDEGGPEHP